MARRPIQRRPLTIAADIFAATQVQLREFPSGDQDYGLPDNLSLQIFMLNLRLPLAKLFPWLAAALVRVCNENALRKSVTQFMQWNPLLNVY